MFSSFQAATPKILPALRAGLQKQPLKTFTGVSRQITSVKIFLQSVHLAPDYKHPSHPSDELFVFLLNNLLRISSAKTFRCSAR